MSPLGSIIAYNCSLCYIELKGLIITATGTSRAHLIWFDGVAEGTVVLFLTVTLLVDTYLLSLLDLSHQ